uniref:Uncharacterized protein n=1 Tax=Arundo donax TaxID=35708 RepID=A0A0A9EAX0_ARUDO
MPLSTATPGPVDLSVRNVFPRAALYPHPPHFLVWRFCCCFSELHRAC